MGDLTTWPVGASGAAAAAAGTAARTGAVFAADCMTEGATTCWTPPPLTIRTFPSASVISSSETFDSDTRSINVFSLRKSMDSPAPTKAENLQQNSTTFVYLRRNAAIFQESLTFAAAWLSWPPSASAAAAQAE